jgi:hypothetical protein
MEQLVTFGILIAAAIVVAALFTNRSKDPKPSSGEEGSDRPAAIPQSAGVESGSAEGGSGMHGEIARPKGVEAGSAIACIALGIVLMWIGFDCLVVNPSITADAALGANIVNLQRLDIGQACVIAGAIFLAAGIRPRRL